MGTTDLRFDGDPQDAIASTEEVQYLVEMVNSVFADLGFSTADVDLHYCGVRPLPFVRSGRTGSIPRGHSRHTSQLAGIPLHTLIGGKLTTWRAFGEEVADQILSDIGLPRTQQTRDRLLPGAEDFPDDPEQWCRTTANELGTSTQTLVSLFNLLGTDCRRFIDQTDESNLPHPPELPIPAAVVMEMIQREWVTCLEDLIERRLCLVFGQVVTRSTLEFLADCLIASGRLNATDREAEIERCQSSLQRRYGLCVNDVNSN